MKQIYAGLKANAQLQPSSLQFGFDLTEIQKVVELLTRAHVPVESSIKPDGAAAKFEPPAAQVRHIEQWSLRL